jgi:hypothetical protein
MKEPEILPEFPEARRKGKYPWDQWLDGQVRVLRRGEHYETTTPSMRAIAGDAAKREGKGLRTRAVSEDGTEALIIQAIPGE